MKSSTSIKALAYCVALTCAAVARAGALPPKHAQTASAPAMPTNSNALELRAPASILTFPAPDKTQDVGAPVPTLSSADPVITPPPGAQESGYADEDDLAERFVQTTYFSCVTLGTYSHCGWHEPILDTSSAGSSIHESALQRQAYAGLSAVLCLMLLCG